MMDKNALEQLLRQAYEIEGLLLVMKNKGDAADAVVYDQLDEKVAELGAMTRLFTFSQASEEDLAQNAQDVEETPAEEPAEEPADEPVAEPAPAAEPTPPVFKHEPAAEPVVEPAAEPVKEQKRVEEVVRQSLAQDLHKAFTLADRFRFRSALFHGNDGLMTSTIDRIQNMHSWAQVEILLFNELRLDPNSPDVEAFVDIVRHRF